MLPPRGYGPANKTAVCSRHRQPLDEVTWLRTTKAIWSYHLSDILVVFDLYKSCYRSHHVQARHAALSTVLRTTTFSYGNMRFSGTCPAETPQPIKMKFCTIDYVGEVTQCANNNCNQLAGGGPTGRWNITSKTFSYYTLLYLTYFSCNRLQRKRLNRFARTMAPTTRFAVRNYLMGGRIGTKLHFGVKTSRKPQNLEPGCQISSQINTHE
jgi:hypothetical protein